MRACARAAAHDNSELTAAGADGDAACLAQCWTDAEGRLPAAAVRAAVQHARLSPVHADLAARLRARARRAARRLLLPLHVARATTRSCCSAAAPASRSRRATRPSSASPSARRPRTPGSSPATTSSRSTACRFPPSMPVNEEALAEHANDPAYIAMGNLLFGTDSAEVPLTVRDSGRAGARRHGHDRRATISTPARKALGISPKLAELHRPAARPRLPVPAVGGLAASPPQLARRGQLDPVARGAADDRRRAAVVDVPRARSAFRAGSTSRSSTSATSCCWPASCCSRTAICRGGVSALIASLADPDVPAGHALPDLLRLLHDHRRPVAAAHACG